MVTESWEIGKCAISHTPIITKTDNYTLTSNELGKTVRMNSTLDKTFTFPSVGSGDDGARLTLQKIGAGRVTLQMVDIDKVYDSSATGTMYCDATVETYGTVTLEYCHATVTWNIISAVGTWITT